MKIVLATLIAMTFASHSSAQTTPAPAVSADISHSASRPPYDGAPEHFTGKVRVDPLFSANAPSRASAANVTFEPGARTDWHVHPLGQRRPRHRRGPRAHSS